MTLVDKEEKILREVIQQCGRRCAGLTALDHPGVVLNAVAEADLCHHFQIVGCPLGDSLGFHQLILRPEPGHLLVALPLDLHHGPGELIPGGNIVAGRIDGHMVNIPFRHTGDRIDLADPVDLVTEELHPDSSAAPVSRINLQGITPNPEFISGKIQVISFIADLGQFLQHRIQRVFIAYPKGNDHALIINRVTQAIQTTDRRHHNDIPPLKQG